MIEYSPFVVLSFLVSIHVGECSVTQFLDTVSGELQGGNFSYFSLQHPGLIVLELISHSGDCDLYASQFNSKPTFELESYCSASNSCGLDKIIVPTSYKRPFAFGVYGHPSFEVSTYTLNIYQIIESSDADNESDELYVTTKYANFYADFEEDNSEESIFHFFLNLIISFFESIWNFLKYVYGEEYDSSPYSFFFRFLTALF